MTKPKLIGLGYRARSGKDTVGDYLRRTHGYKRVGFADKLKEVAGLLTGDDPFDPEFKNETTIFGLTGGQLLQQLGSLLKTLDPAIWTKASHLQAISCTEPLIVVTDVLYTTEAALIKKLGGQLWRIDRPGLPYDSHSSETEGAKVVWDRVIVNNSTLPALFAAVDAVLEGLPPVNVVG